MSDVPAPPAEAPSPLSPRSRAVYAVLVLLAGPSGCHNFYIGRWRRGALQLLCAAPAMWVLDKWMLELRPVLATLTAGDPAASLDEIASLTQAALPDSPLLFGLLVSAAWAIADLFLVKTDGKGRLLK